MWQFTTVGDISNLMKLVIGKIGYFKNNHGCRICKFVHGSFDIVLDIKK